MISLVLASHNAKKLAELQAILQEIPVRILSLRDMADAPQVLEDGKTFEENAAKKALAIARWCGKPALADDSGLCVDALDGAPGVYSARFAGEGKSDEENNRKLLDLMKKIPRDKRGAAFHCVIAIACPQKGLIGLAKGECRGWIAEDLQGTHGFGYDPLFIHPATGKRFAELESGFKNRISHRAQALQAARGILSNFIKTADLAK